MKNCQQIENLIDDFLHKDLTVQEESSFLSHLQGCHECSEKVAAEKKLLDTLCSLPPYVPTDQLVRKTMDKIYSYQEHSRSAIFGFLHESPRPVFNLALAFSLVLLMVINLNIYQNSKTIESAQPTVTTTKSPAIGLHAVKFVFNIPKLEGFDVHNVSVVGDFNGWNPVSDKMAFDKRSNAWTLDLKLKAGNYDYMYVINDKVWVADPKAEKKRDDGFGGKNSVLEL